MAKQKKNLNEMSFLDHLEELRWLLVRCSAGILIGGVVAYYFSDFIIDTIILGPKKGDFITYQFFCDLANAYNLDKSFCNTEMPFTLRNGDMEGQFSLLVWTCITAGLIISFPTYCYNFGILLALHYIKKKKKNAIKFIVISSLFFFRCRFWVFYHYASFCEFFHEFYHFQRN